MAIAHCNEIDDKELEELRALDPTFQFLNLCSTVPVLGTMSLSQAGAKLRGFYCKIAALVESPFTETMITDIDVVWFKQPDWLFSAPGYRDTGTLFMRERMYMASVRTTFQPNELVNYFKSVGIHVENKTVVAERLQNGNYPSLFWKPLMSSDNPQNELFLSDYQDSSVVLVNKQRHPVLLSTLLGFLQNGVAIGYGDKELFWIAATVANEPFAFEPYVGGQYRDCHGVLVHFDPSVLPGSGVTPAPFYMNGEFLVERKSEPVINGQLKELNYIGEYLQNVISKPIAASADVSFVDYRSWAHDLDSTGCTCRSAHNSEGVIDCMAPPTEMNDHLLMAEWLTYASTLDPKLPPKMNENCVPVSLSVVQELNRVLAEQLVSHSNDTLFNACSIGGCPALPIVVYSQFPWAKLTVPHGIGQYCEPVSFVSPDDKVLAAVAEKARSKDVVLHFNRPDVAVGKSVLCLGCGGKVVYLLKDDQKLHQIPDVGTFMKLGLDFSDTVALPHRQFATFEIGEPV
jgi:hypothetical protein